MHCYNGVFAKLKLNFSYTKWFLCTSWIRWLLSYYVSALFLCLQQPSRPLSTSIAPSLPLNAFTGINILMSNVFDWIYPFVYIFFKESTEASSCSAPHRYTWVCTVSSGGLAVCFLSMIVILYLIMHLWVQIELLIIYYTLKRWPTLGAVAAAAESSSLLHVSLRDGSSLMLRA